MFISKEEFVSKFKDRITATKKISRIDGVEDVLTRIYYTIQFFNTRPEFTISIGGRQMCDILIANEWKDFILPESVRLDPTDLKTANLLVPVKWDDIDKSAVVSDESPEPTKTYVTNLHLFDPSTYLQFINDQATIRSYFKSDLNSNVTNLATLRINKSLMDMIPILRIAGTDEDKVCRSLDEPYIPVQLVDGIGSLFRTDYFNTSIKDIFADYISKKVIV